MTELAGKRVFLVEDEGSVALLIEAMLEDLGCIVVASAAHLSKAQRLAGEIAADLAVLDVNIGGQLVFPVCDILAERGIPFIFSSGYGADGLRPNLRTWPVLKKPFTDADLHAALAAALSRD
ncbi:response regulator [Rhodoligotrophos ferricapiens]|uniref:response regulator n=1 Tax=Rhodoligotrophos ferricapiens TaxID=3069264 RepID=UPI00315D79E8